MATTGAKKGRPGNRIKDAYADLTNIPTPVNNILSKHQVSLPVLRQTKRFDPTPEKGHVCFKTVEGTLHVWRAAAAEQEKIS